jgi:dTDP-4-dehydrorhamnose 3,5-epimerase
MGHPFPGDFMIEHLAIRDIVLITPKRFGDDRGFFSETYKQSWFHTNVAAVTFIQDNHSLSRENGVVRGLHFQRPPAAQGKLVRCLKGSIFDVAVDLRRGSGSYGRWVGATLTAERGEQLWIPEGFAHGFCTLEPDTEVFYKVTSEYSPAHDAGVAFDDPAIGVDWPINPAKAILSPKDKVLPGLDQLGPVF